MIAKYRDRWGGYGALGDDALVLHIGMGPVYYLFRDGYIRTDDFLDADSELRLASDDEAAEGSVLGSFKLGAPELLSLLPERPTDAVMCEQCNGTRWMRIEGLNAEWLCFACHGRGWKVG